MQAEPHAASAEVEVRRAGRAGEELDVEAVDLWLKAQVPTLTGRPRVTQYAGGASNWTYRLSYPERELVLRRPPLGTKAKSAHDMAREYRVQHALRSVYPAVPEMIALCQDPAVLGCDFYVMARIEGIIPSARLPKGVRLTPAQARALSTHAIDQLVALHRVDVERAGLSSLGKGPGYARRQIEGWSRRYDDARTWNVPRFTRVKAWLKERVPEDAGACLIHNDYRLDNLVLDVDDPTRVVGVLDWEMATIGCPLLDLGNSMAYWIQADDNLVLRSTSRQPTHLPGMLTRREVVDYYTEQMGLKVDDWAFYEVYGMFRLAVIVQQIYYRYFHKQTKSKAFRHYWLLLHYLELRCHGVMARSPS
jgi:aminoglycoside phosphotransferase (APT) family kinase protein